MDELQNYDYELPAELIARHPPESRDAARLLVVDRTSGNIAHHHVRDLPQILSAEDRLVLNDTQVIPARLLGFRSATGGKWEGLFLETTAEGNWRLLGKSRGRMNAGEQITVVATRHQDAPATLDLTLVDRTDDGSLIVRPEVDMSDHLDLLRRFGTVPLPPYVRREMPNDMDWERYQTTFARRPGAIAAPTAGLHFTPQLLEACQERGIGQTHVTLHVGIGTFRPITADRLSEHKMHSEWCELTPDAVADIEHTKTRGGRVVAIGTTAVRTLESAAESGKVQPFRGHTDLFIRPPYQFHAVDCLLTNFHLPRTSLLVLVSTFASVDLIRAAYRSAIQERYRFYSYGDAMLIL